MHMSPGIPIMKSKNLVNWTTVNYAYDRLVENDKMNLQNGLDAYGDGSWASSINYRNGKYYIHSFSYTSGKSHLYQTSDIENGPYTAYTMSSLAHDASLFIDDDGKAYLAYGHDNIELRELNSEITDFKVGSSGKVIIQNASGVAGANMILTAEGTQMFKINGYYYVMNICWPQGNGRTVVIHRSKNIAGPYEGRIALQDQGVAQGGLISTPDGKWYAYLFQDHGAVGRIPYLVPVTWSDNWPIFGVNGKVPSTLDIPLDGKDLSGIVASDDFSKLQTSNHGLKMEWQWNHNPVQGNWSLTERPGYLRLRNDRVDANFLATRNTLTQRSFGPACTASVAVDISNMKDGDIAGLGALQYDYGYIGVKMVGNTKSIVMVNATNSNPVEIASAPLNSNTVHLRIRMDFNNKTDKAYFQYSLDGQSWTSLGNVLQMSYKLEHFMGYRFALFNYGTKQKDGVVDFDYYKINSLPFQTIDRNFVYPIPGKVEAEHFSTMNGILTEFDEYGVENVGWVNSGDWSQYRIDVADSGNYTMQFRVATGADEDNEIVIKNANGSVLGTKTVLASQSNGWHDWYLDSITIPLDTGSQELRLEYLGTSTYLFNLDWLQFEKTSIPVSAHFSKSRQSTQILARDLSNQKLEILVSSTHPSTYQVSLIDLTGKTIYKQFGSGVKKFIVPLSQDLHGTTYLVVTQNGKTLYSRPLGSALLH